MLDLPMAPATDKLIAEMLCGETLPSIRCLSDERSAACVSGGDGSQRSLTAPAPA